eukprot:TRINITY_DN51838_c0_g1_i1.p1 TRINITY_DN51838_c0_g1~~TRINITY_DN51838_c0_g1_i1.p1  ORF type:complete len:237 (-),score=41.37 TRINITY_DN51838_c0_g1_i1:78-725(-)
MYALRMINNGYSDHAGTRSDFVVVGHPEYNLGKVRSDYGYKEGWDTRGIPCLPPRSIPGDKIRRMGTARYIKALSEPEKKPKYKDRVLAKSRSDTQVGMNTSHGSDGGGFEGFIQELESCDRLPSCAPNRLTAGYANHSRHQPVMKHYTAVQEDLNSLKTRLRMSPETVKAELQIDDSWRYYSQYLKQAKKNENQLRHTKFKAAKTVEKAMRGPD